MLSELLRIFFLEKIVIFFSKFFIFDSKFLENYITGFQTETSFKLNRARASKWYIFLVSIIKFFSSLISRNFRAFILLKNSNIIKSANLDHPRPNIKISNAWMLPTGHNAQELRNGHLEVKICQLELLTDFEFLVRTFYFFNKISCPFWNLL